MALHVEPAHEPDKKGKPEKVKANGSGAEHPTVEAAIEAAVHGEEVPNLEELPEEKPAEANRPSVAAAAAKFKRYGERRGPNAEMVPLKKRLVNLPVRTMPHREWFVRISKNPEHRGTLPLFWDKGGDGVGYLVDGEAHNYLDAKPNDCVLATTKQGSLFLWCSPLEDDDGRWNDWHQSAYDMKELAADDWISPKSNRQSNGYEPFDPDIPITVEPKFPDNLKWEEIVHLAFRRRLIEKEDHPVIKRIRNG